MRSRLVLAVVLLAAAAQAGAAQAGDYRLEKRFDLAAGGTFVLSTEAGGIELRGADGSQAVVVVTSRRQDFEQLYDVRFDQRGPDRLEVRIERRGHGPLGWFSAANSGGNVTVELPRKVKAGLDSSGGGIVGAGIDGDVDASSSGGGVRIEEAGGRVDADSTGGPVQVTFAAGNAHGGSLDSSGGGVKVRLDPAVALQIDAESTGGGLDCDLPVTVRGKVGRDTLRGQLNGGGALLRVRSTGGGITLTPR